MLEIQVMNVGQLLQRTGYSLQWFSKCGPQISNISTSLNLSEMQSLRPHPRLTEIRILGVGPRTLYFKNPPGDSDACQNLRTISLRYVYGSVVTRGEFKELTRILEK